MHREDIMAELRKRNGSVSAFERKLAYKRGTVNDVLRGKPRFHVCVAVAAELNMPVAFVFPNARRPRAAKSVISDIKPVRESRKREAAVAS
jgi:lambda repressor-like predicted transcriptional regulator